MSGSFFDTNVLIYLTQNDPDKTNRVDQLLVRGGQISVQVLNEIANVSRRKHNKSWEEIETFLDLLKRLLKVSPLTLAVHQSGLHLARRYRLSVYDGMIVAAALSSECDVLWSEDMHNGLLIEGAVRIQNPFETRRS